MFEYELVRLANGVNSVRSRSEGETFHPVIGPVEEARLLYVDQLNLVARVAATRREFVIWDIGLGAAANVLTALEALKNLPARVLVLSFDHTLEPLRFTIKQANELGYPASYESELTTLAEKERVNFKREALEVDWRVQVADFPTLLNSSASADWPKPDAILFDAFSPAKNPAMWTLPLFRRLYELLDPARPCAMPTYSRSTMLRVTLALAGFYVGAGAAIAEKEETTIAANDLSLIRSPLGKAWLRRARNSTCAEPLQTPLYTRSPLTEPSWAALQIHRQFAS